MAPAGISALPPSRTALWGLAFLLVCAGALAQNETIQFRLVKGVEGSAKPTAEKLLRHLAAGEIEAAAELSNSPRRRLEELAKYRATVGEAEFKRIYSSYFLPANPVVAEVAIGAHRLIIWNLGDAGNHLAGQFYVEAEGRFLMDDIPGETRTQLRRVLEAYRTGKLRF